jgi:hypothetical protein
MLEADFYGKCIIMHFWDAKKIGKNKISHPDGNRQGKDAETPSSQRRRRENQEEPHTFKIPGEIPHYVRNDGQDAPGGDLKVTPTFFR